MPNHHVLGCEHNLVQTVLHHDHTPCARARAGCRAMGGSVKFQDALAARLDLMAVSQQRLSDFLAAHPAALSPGAALPPACYALWLHCLVMHK